jgi:uncharacterized protein (DUF1330 family)
MAVYLIVDTDLFDPAGYEDYKVKAKPIVEKFGGEYLARGGKLDVKESDLWSPQRLVLIRFTAAEQAQSFYHSAEYQAVLPISHKSAKRTVVLLEGV